MSTCCQADLRASLIQAVNGCPIKRQRTVNHLIRRRVGQVSGLLRYDFIQYRYDDPRGPINLNVDFAIVRQRSVLVLFTGVMDCLFLYGYFERCLRVRRFVPCRVMFLTPYSKLIGDRTMIVTIIYRLRPFNDRFFNFLYVFLDRFFLTRLVNRVTVEHCARSNFSERINIIYGISNGIIYAGLVFQVRSVLDRVVNPNYRCVPIFLHVINVSFSGNSNYARSRRVSQFLSQRVSAMYLTIDRQVDACVVYDRQLVPFSTFTVVRSIIRRAFYRFQVMCRRREDEEVDSVRHASQAITRILF